MVQEKIIIPAFNPTEYEIKSRTYGNTGGGCMVGTLKVYIPEIDKTVWVNCSDEIASIDAGDVIWDEENDGSWENAYDLNIYSVTLEDEIPEDVRQWLPMIKEALAYTVEQEIAECDFISLPVAWIPDSIREQADKKYLDWLRKKGKRAEIRKNGEIDIDEEYSGE
ncbi:MAG: hypothetical protein LBQ71_06005 [Hungatella sp.]|nr:hypothetical protein [Hungatella sp.]